MAVGKIKKIVEDKGFGFIQVDGGRDVFFHCSTVSDGAFTELSVGQQVEFTVDQSSTASDRGPRAASVAPA